MASLVTLAQAKTHLRITGTDSDDDISTKSDQATAIVLDYIKRDDDHGWEPGSPGSPGGGSPLDDRELTIVQAAILNVLERLWNREQDVLTEGVMRMLHRLRDPALA